jgi:hypothetical protein
MKLPITCTTVGSLIDADYNILAHNVVIKERETIVQAVNSYSIMLECLKELEWSQFSYIHEDYFCPSCHKVKKYGHDSDCQLANAIKIAKEK